MEDEEDLPELSDSGDEAAWEDENDADLPHDKQQTPCLFCDRFVYLSARLQPTGAQASLVCVVSSSGVEPEWPAFAFLNQCFGGLVKNGGPTMV